MRGLNISSAKLEDFPAVFLLLKQLWPKRRLFKKRIQDLYIRRMKDNWDFLLVAKLGKKLLGFSAFTVDRNFAYAGRIAYIIELVVDEEWRGRGIGKALMKAVEKMARKLKCRAVELDSGFTRLRAHALYESMGYEKKCYFFVKKI